MSKNSDRIWEDLIKGIGIEKRQGAGGRGQGDEEEEGDKEDKGRIIQQVSPLSPPSSLSPLSLIDAQYPIPNTQYQ